MNLFKYTYDLVRQIPPGKVSTYGLVAEALGDKIAARAVGWMMNQNPDADSMPCFKIVYSNGKLGGFGLGIDDKIRRLEQDNVKIEDDVVLNFNEVLFKDFKTIFPLKQLRQEQIKLSKKVKLDDDFNKIKTVAGIDVAYPKKEFNDACGACIIMDYNKKEVIEEKIVFSETDFPYIPTYLFYREFPIIKKLYEKIDSHPSIIMFDGNGILHPYGFGLASQMGVVFDIPTIGVAKSLLSGKLDGNIVKINDVKKGYAVISKKTKKPIYVSPGHKLSFDTCLKVVKNFSFYKIPEPLRKAHILAKESLSRVI